MGKSPIDFKDRFYMQGRVEIITTVGRPSILKLGNDIFIDLAKCKVLDVQDVKNIIVNVGKDYVLRGLAESYTPMRITRMAIGDRGAIPSDSTVPKVPTATMTSLYNEIFRSDIDGSVINVGTPTIHEVKFVKTFSAVDIPITAFSNQSKPVVNEVALIMVDPTSSLTTTREDVAGPYFYPEGSGPYPYPPVDPYWYPPTDEVMFAIRTFKTVPFEAANDISVTIRYTVYIE